MQVFPFNGNSDLLIECLITGALASNRRIHYAISGSRRRARLVLVHFLRVFNGRELLTTIFSNGAHPDFSAVAGACFFEVSSFLSCVLQVRGVQRGRLAISCGPSTTRLAPTGFSNDSLLLIFRRSPNTTLTFLRYTLVRLSGCESDGPIHGPSARRSHGCWQQMA